MRFLLLFACFIATGCMKMPKEQEIFLTHTVFPEAIAALPEPPPTITLEEEEDIWRQEYKMGQSFAAEGDYYRATTCFHRARHLLNAEAKSSPERKAQVVRALILSYSLAGKIQEAIEVWEKEQDKVHFYNKELAEDTICLLFDAYSRLNRESDAKNLLAVLPPQNELHEKLPLYHALASNSSLFPSATKHAEKLFLQTDLENLLVQYKKSTKSPTQAGIYNAILPGAGYLYVGQYKTASTSFLLNALFIAATAELFAAKLPAAALLCAGFEIGWYGGGIIGAKLAAEIYNQRLREILFKPFLEKHALFPHQTMHYKW